MLPEKQSGAGGHPDSAPESLLAAKPLDCAHPIADPDDLARLARRHDYALRVVTERSDGVLVTQLFTSMHPAERKVARARERHLRAHITLVKLTAVPFDLEQFGGGR